MNVRRGCGAPVVNSLATFGAGGTLHDGFHRLNGEVCRTGCCTAVGTRFE